MKHLAIIPARSGSKGLADKNIKILCGAPLLAYSIRAAIESNIFDSILVSTDSEKYADIARNYGADVPFLRSKELSGDTAGSWDVAKEVVDKLNEGGEEFDTICLLQPTSPLRLAEDIVAAYKLFKEKGADSVIGVCEADHSPLWMNTLGADLNMDGFVRDDVEKLNRQQLETFYRINGAIYIRKITPQTFIESVYKNSFAYIMPRDRSIDIDTELDFIMAESIMNVRNFDTKGA